MSDKIEAWCVVTEGDTFAVRLVTLTRQCTAEMEAEAREWLAEHIRIRLEHAAEGVVRWEREVVEAKECLDDARAELEEWRARAVAAGVSLEAAP